MYTCKAHKHEHVRQAHAMLCDAYPALSMLVDMIGKGAPTPWLVVVMRIQDTLMVVPVPTAANLPDLFPAEALPEVHAVWAKLTGRGLRVVALPDPEIDERECFVMFPANVPEPPGVDAPAVTGDVSVVEIRRPGHPKINAPHGGDC